MEKLVLLAAVCLLGVSRTLAVSPCASVHTGAVSPAIPLPMLPTKAFKSVVRAEIVNKNMTVEATEYVDESANAATIVLNQQGVKATVIMSYKTNEVFYIEPDSSGNGVTAGAMACVTNNLTTDDNTALFGMKTAGPGGMTGHLYSTSQILNFINGTEVYKGKKMIDGVPCNWWSSCVYWAGLKANFTLDYYFTVPNYTTPSGLDQIPMRAEVRGIANKNGSVHNFHHIYQYVNFEPYVNDPETIFETPPGVYCLLRKPAKTIPQLAKHFYYREEISDSGVSDGGYPTISESDIWYDYPLELIRFDSRSQPTGVSKDLSLSNGPYSVIHDYSVGVQYTVAKDINECSVDPIPVDAKGFDGVYNITRKTLGIRSPMQFFDLDDKMLLYAGQRKARGQQCDVYQTVLTDVAGALVTLYEVYFLSSNGDDITDRGTASDAPVKAIPMRLMMWQSGQLVNQYEIHDFDQDAATANVFDVTACFPGTSSKDFEIFLKLTSATGTGLMPQLAPYIGQLMQLEVSIDAGVSPLRLQKTRLHWDSSNVYFQGTLLGAAPSLAKFEMTPGKTMSGSTKSLPNIGSVQDCSTQCDTLQEWTCTQFDYCATTLTCTLGRTSSTAPLRNSTQCNHYQRVLGMSFDNQAPIDKVWNDLKNRVYGDSPLSISLPLPDSTGKIDMNIDTSTLDDTQKVTLKAFYITNEVVSNVNRNPVSSMVMTQFNVIPQKEAKGYDTLVRGVSVDDCAARCAQEQTYNCQAFWYFWDSGACFLSRLHPDERPNLLKDNTACDLYIRDYTSNFQEFAGQTVLSDSNTIYQSVATASQCAKLCMYYKSFHCESFDFCTDVSTCYLGSTHYYDAPKSNIKQAPSCDHFSRDYIQDFTMTAHKTIQLRNNRVVQGVTPQQCARLCVEEPTFTCQSFDYCGNLTECRLTDASMAYTGQTTLEASAYCDVYMRQAGTYVTPAPANNNPGSNHTPSPGNNNNPGGNKTPSPGGNQTPAPGGNQTPAPGNHNPGGNPTPSPGNTGAKTGQQTAGNSGSSSGYSSGAMGGLAFGMILFGAVLGLVGLFVYDKYFRRPRGSTDGMAMSFSKAEDMDS